MHTIGCSQGDLGSMLGILFWPGGRSMLETLRVAREPAVGRKKRGGRKARGEEGPYYKIV